MTQALYCHFLFKEFGMKFIIFTASIFSTIMSFAAIKSNNPLTQKWTGPFGGVPPFDKVKVSDFKDGLEQGITELKKEIEAIANNPAPATFENTLEALENTGLTLDRVGSLFNVWGGSMSTPEYRAIEQEMSPKLAAIQDEIIQNTKLFQRIDAVYNSPEKAKLTAEQQRLVWYQDTKFIISGAKLDDKGKVRVAAINQRLATLSTQFSQNEMADEEDDFLTLDKVSDLEGLPKSLVEGAAAEAARRKLTGKWVIGNFRSSMEPFLTYSPNRQLREKAFRIWTSRGDNDNSHNNNKIVTEILKLRAERSQLLGYPTYAHWHLADTMAKDPKVAMDLMLKVWKPAVARVKTEVADMQALVDAEKKDFKIQPWDYRYYAEKVRKAKYDLDFDLVKPYLQLDNIRKAMFWSAGKLFGYKFIQVKNLPVYNSSMSTYKVLNAKGKFVGLWYFDPYARPGKNSGAWMSNYRDQYKFGGKDITTIVSNNSNFVPGKPGEPITISWDDANTMFHEFGHALHGLSSNVTYKSLSGTNTTRDFVEFPSQLNEHYLETAGVLKFLVNSEGKPMPKSLIEKIEKARTFNSGFSTVEFLASGIIDMKLHLVGDKEIDPKTFETTALKELGMPSEIVMRHRIPQFGHIFSSEGYASGYYGYLWAQVLDCDAFEAFTETGDPYNKTVAKKYYDYIISVGNTQDPAENYRKFRGRDAKPDALMRQRGFPVTNETL
jgi:peptidyl-dipeptidase Dcp